MDKVTENRLKRCKTCRCPHDGPDGMCPGNLGVGCIGDWRCCAEYNAVCMKCLRKDVACCEDTLCKAMERFRLQDCTESNEDDGI